MLGSERLAHRLASTRHRPEEESRLWIGMSGDLLIASCFVGSFDQDALLEPCSGSDECDEVGGVHGPPTANPQILIIAQQGVTVDDGEPGTYGAVY